MNYSILKRALTLLLALLLIGCFPTVLFAEQEIETEAKSVILIEAESGKVLYEENADEPLPPASVTKIMTLLLVMEAIKEGKISLEDQVSTSERAASMGGSQVYLEVGEQMTVDEMIKCVVVASANDAAAALAEHVAGSLEAFVSQMNKRAQELGMTATNFENTNGLDDTTTNHVTSARDIATMSRELLKYDKILEYTWIWMDTVRNGAFGLTNTNRLIRFYKGANGLKTGYTSGAGFCISATAKRDGMQLIAVVMASPTSNERNATAVKLLDYGFANYEFFKSEECGELSLPVKAGKKEQVSLQYGSTGALLQKGQGKNVKEELTLPEELVAPVQKGQVVGKITWRLDGKEIGCSEIVATQDVPRLSFLDLFVKLLNSYALF